MADANVLQFMKSGHASASTISASEIDALAREARADAEKLGQLVVRPHAAYVLQAANRAGKISQSTTANDLRHILAGRILARANLNGLMTKSPDTQQEVRERLGLQTAQATNQKRDS